MNDFQDEPEPALYELIDGAVRKIVTAIFLAGALIAFAIYMRPGPPRYQVSAGDGKIVRIDTDSGTVIACEDGRCWTALRRGQRLDRRPERAAPDKQETAPPRIAPPEAAPSPAAPAASPENAAAAAAR